MGYTIYWYRKLPPLKGCSVEVWANLQSGVQAILAAAAAQGIPCEVIEISSARIAFNGPEGESCDSF